MVKVRTLQLYRGTTAQNNAYTGSAGELTMDTTTNELRLHDGITTGGHIIGSGGGSGSGYHPDLFDVKWADHICNDVQWLRADTFSWQSGAVYQAAYAHLVLDIDGKTLQTETISGTTIQFYLADDGHKICPASEESNVTAIYNATGVAWYYIIDTTNQRFKLPRTQFAFTGIRSGVGGYVEAGLPNLSLYTPNSSEKYGSQQNAVYNTGSTSGTSQGIIGVNQSYKLYIKDDNNIVGNSNTVQPKATEMYLYFYVGAFTQTAIENTAGLNTELFNQKADLNLSNTASNIDFVVESQEPTAANNYTWYRKYKSGWVEQGGNATNQKPATITLPVEMADTNYTLLATGFYASRTNTNGARWSDVSAWIVSTTTVTMGGSTLGMCWQVSGIAA